MKKEAPPSAFALSIIDLAKDPFWKSVIQIGGGLLLAVLVVGGIFLAFTVVGLPFAFVLMLTARSVGLILKKI